MKRAALAVVLLAARAHADPVPAKAEPDPEPDSEAERAGDANLEPLDKRQGLVFGISIGPSLTFGADVGTGGAVSLRVGHVATPRLVFQLELNGSAVVHSVEDTMNPDKPGRLVANA